MLQRQGFSLIELMVIVSIIALLTAIAIPTYRNYYNKAITANAAVVLNDLNAKAMSLYNEGQLTVGVSSVFIDGITFTDNSAISVNYPPVIGTMFFVPGDGIVASNAWMFCVYVGGLNFSGYVQGIGGAYSRMCSKVKVNNGIFSSYCGQLSNASTEIPTAYLPDECSTTNVQSI